MRRVAAPYKLRVNKFVQTSRSEISAHIAHFFHYSLLLITLSEAKQAPQSRLIPRRFSYRGSQYQKTAAQGSILGRLRLLFFYAVKNFFCRLRVGGYLVAERSERIKYPFGADISEQFYFDIFSVEVAGEVGLGGLAAQIVAGERRAASHVRNRRMQFSV